LTNEQYKVIDALVDNPRVMIRGGPGTGKSLLALREARRIAQTDSRVLLCCFNRQLALHLGSCLNDCPSATVVHLHGFMAELVKKAGLSHRLPAAEPADLFEVFYPELCVEVLLESGTDEFDALIIDEGQDLLREAYIDVFDGLLKGGIKSGLWRVFYDPNQDIYKGQQPEALRLLDDAFPAQFRLFTNCRNTQPIAVATSLLAGTRCDETLVVAGPEVRKQWYRTPAQQARQMSNHINFLLGEGVRPEEIVILSKRRLQNSALALGLRAVPVPLVDVGQLATKPSDKSLRFSTVAAFKGLESEAVLLADVDDLTSDEAREILYVGTSRARVLLALFFSESVRADYDLCAFRFGEQLASGVGLG
jgi:superfamily I DNA/RNA helicase